VSDEASADACLSEPPEIPRQLDPVSTVFFVSHKTAPDHEAGEPTEPNAVFVKFCRDLTRDLDQLVPRRAGADAGFIDRELRSGEDWDQEIMTAIGTCQVLVALVSQPFYDSDYCGKEWDAFTRRRTYRRKDRELMREPRCALRILWTPERQQVHPPALAKLQLFRPDPTSHSELGQLYLREGLYGMYRAEKDAYEATVWRIALEVQRLVTNYWVETRIPENSNSLTNVFAAKEEQP
jgi:hypothetical protein